MSKKFRILSLLLCLCLTFEQMGFAQSIGQLDISGYLTSLRNNIPQDKFRPLHLRYLAYDSLSNNFSLLVDKGSNPTIKKVDLEDSTKSLMNYFFIGLSLPNDAFWVNLRPDAENNIIDDELAKTDIGKIMLEADVQLKKDTARYTSPQTPEGKEYWDKLYKKAGEIFGYENVEIPTLTRPWIVPDEILVGETKDGAYIFKATLKVLLEQDYLKDSAVYNFSDERLKALNEYSSQFIRELIIPKITREVNTSKKYAPLRQVYYSLILAQHFKQRFQNRGGYNQLVDRKNLSGLTSKVSWSKTTYFKEYQKSFKNGEYNLNESVYTPSGQIIRSYFSGGIKLASSSPVNNAFPADTVPHNSNLSSLQYDGNTKRIRTGGGSTKDTPALSSWLPEYINEKISQLSSNDRDRLVKQSWESIYNDPDNPVIIAINVLTENGVEIKFLKKLIDVLFSLRIDVTNPWSTSYQISDIIGYLSMQLLGQDLSQLKPSIRRHDFINDSQNIDFEYHPLSLDKASITTLSLEDLRKRCHELREDQRKAILSRNNYRSITAELSNDMNNFLEGAIRNLLHIVWKELNIPPDSEAILYFRDMKTLASDLDLFYWGPRIEEVNLRLTELLFLLGFKRDLFSTLLMTHEISNGRIDYDVYHYFFNGRIIEINHGSFARFYQDNIKSKVDLDKIWRDLYPYLSRQLAAWNKQPFAVPLEITDFKKLLYRAVTNLLFGLAKKFEIDFGPDDGTFFEKLSRHLEGDELQIIVDALDLTNQSRNLYQVITERRWEKDIDEPTIKKIRDLISQQGIADYDTKVKELGERLESIRAKYFGAVDFRETEYLPLYTDERSLEAWRKVAKAYTQIIQNVESQYVVQLSKSEEKDDKHNKESGGNSGLLGSTAQNPPVEKGQVTDKNKGSSPLGGIDFRTLPIVTQAINNLKSVNGNIRSLNLNQEWQEIERLVQLDISPSSERMKEYLQSSCSQGKITQDKKRVITCISEILRQQEEHYVSADPILRDILIVLESNNSIEDFRAIFISIKQ